MGKDEHLGELVVSEAVDLHMWETPAWGRSTEYFRHSEDTKRSLYVKLAESLRNRFDGNIGVY